MFLENLTISILCSSWRHRPLLSLFSLLSLFLLQTSHPNQFSAIASSNLSNAKMLNTSVSPRSPLATNERRM